MGSAVEPKLLSWACGAQSDLRKGLLGYLAVEYGDLVLDGITLRRTAQGRITLSFPARTDSSGRRHAYVRPVDDQARQTIENAILPLLVRETEGSP